MTHPLDPDLCKAVTRAEAAEVRCARLEGALCDAILLAEQGHYKSEAIQRWRAILSDTAQQETDMMEVAVQMVSMAELEDLRERAAKLAKDYARMAANDGERHVCLSIATKLRALPLEETPQMEKVEQIVDPYEFDEDELRFGKD